ncbi:MAG: hypothetical protein PUP90_05320 [Nostoc sp. S4]|nr:hypothetical protein [Nostoc sp. S4]
MGVRWDNLFSGSPLLKQLQTENDQRFNILLEEVRYLSRRNQQD